MRCQVTVSSLEGTWPSRIRSRISPGRLSPRKARNSSRNANSSAVKRKSIAPTPLLSYKAGAAGDRQRQLGQADDQQQADQQGQDIGPVIRCVLRNRYLGKPQRHQQADPHRRQEEADADGGGLDDVEV